MKNDYYKGELWKNELESIAMPMLDSYDVILCETSKGYVVTALKKANMLPDVRRAALAIGQRYLSLAIIRLPTS